MPFEIEKRIEPEMKKLAERLAVLWETMMRKTSAPFRKRMAA